MKPRFKPVQQAESSMFNAVIEKSNEEFEYPWHYHPEFELTYILSGKGIRYVGNSIENFGNDDLVLLGSQLPHCWIKTDDQDVAAKAVVIYLHQSFFKTEFLRTIAFSSIQKLFELSSKGIRFSQKMAVKLKPKLVKLPTLPPFEKVILLLEILQELSNTNEMAILCSQGFSYELSTTNNERLNIIYDYIRKNYRNKITLAGVAASVHMSDKYFSRYFSKVMKKTFFEYLNEYKINRACKLLIETDKPISEICYESGFENVPFFYRQFKKFKNCQPKMFKKSYNKVAY